MLPLLSLELKKIREDYRRLLFSVLFMLAIGGAVYAVARELADRESLFEPFSIGVVDYDQSMETGLLIRFFNNTKDFSKTITLQVMEAEEAAQMLKDGSLPAYFVIPANFVDDVKTGRNSAFRFYGSRKLPLQAALARLLAEGGVAFLSSSQSGIYATIDYALENGLDSETVDNSVVMPINILFATKLLAFQDFFEEKVVTLSAGLPVSRYYLFSFSGFLLLLLMTVWVPGLQKPPGVTIRYKAAGIPLAVVRFAGFFKIFTVNMILCAPLYYFFGYKIIFMAACSSGFAVMTAEWFASRQAAGIFIFFFALLCLLASGGVVPMAYLPAVFHKLQYLTPNYWIIRLGSGYGSALALSGMTLLFGIVAGLAGMRKGA